MSTTTSPQLEVSQKQDLESETPECDTAALVAAKGGGEHDAKTGPKVPTERDLEQKRRWAQFLRRGPALVKTPMRKNIILIVVALCGLLGPLTSAIYTPALTIAQADFQTTDLLINLTITVATLTLGVAPLGWATAADTAGRRPVLISASVIAVGGCIGCYFSSSIGLFLFWRVIQSTGCSAGMSVGAGVVADIFEKEQRGRAMGTFMLGAILGPVISPPIGGAFAQTIGWRVSFLFSAAYAALTLVLVFFFLPETLAPLPPGSLRPSRNPFTSFVELRHLFVLAMQFMGTVAFASFYTFPPLIPRDWPLAYHFDSAGVGFVMMAMGLGMCVGTVVGGWFADATLAWWKKRRGGLIIAEDRLWSSVPAYGWLLEERVAWPATMTAAVCIGLGQLFFNSSCNTYLVDIYQSNAASIIALGNFLRFSVGAFMPLIVVPASSLNRGTLYSILTAVNLAGILGVFWTARWGTVVRLHIKPWSERPGASETLAAVYDGEEAPEVDRRRIVAGKDLRAGGIWMGLDGESGRFGVITNFPDHYAHGNVASYANGNPTSASSRGDILKRWLTGTEMNVSKWLSSSLAGTSMTYEGFSVIIGRVEPREASEVLSMPGGVNASNGTINHVNADVWYATNRGLETDIVQGGTAFAMPSSNPKDCCFIAQKLQPDRVYGLSNAQLGVFVTILFAASDLPTSCHPFVQTRRGLKPSTALTYFPPISLLSKAALILPRPN
ncbi:hypothetical protein HDU93_009258 [Gonapodya sp. JEL0774]|nr:hypothetical protein HDU93_009258 [Gonapodya sp. JEL0774]